MLNNRVFRAHRRKFKNIAAAVAIAISTIVLIGWTIDLPFLTQIYPGSPPMKVNTALALLFAGFALFFISATPLSLHERVIPIACGSVTLLIGSLTLIQYIAGLDIGIDNFIFAAHGASLTAAFPGRMSPHAAVNLTLLGSAILLLRRGRSFSLGSEVFAILSLLTTFAAALGHLYGAHYFYGVSAFNSMALHTAFSCGVIAIGLLSANSDSRLGRLLLSGSIGGATARRLLPVAVLVPTVTGWLRMVGQERGYYDTGSGLALMTIVSVALLCTFIYYLSHMARSVDLRRKAAEIAVTANEQKYRNLVDHGQGFICMHDIDGTLTMVNPAAYASLGYTEQEMVGRNLRELLPPGHRAGFDIYLRMIVNEGIADGMFPILAKCGKTLVFRYHNVLVSEQNVEPYVLGHGQDVTKLLEAQNELKNLSLTDDLTGLYNRRGFLTLAAQQLKLEKHSGTARGLSVIFADMDGLKAINDTFGHEAGSNAIKDISQVIQASVRGADIVARWGGDEFIILSVGSDDESVRLIVNRLKKNLSAHNAERTEPYELGFSIGSAPLRPDGTKSIEEVIAEADNSMYEDKKRRKASRPVVAAAF